MPTAAIATAAALLAGLDEQEARYLMFSWINVVGIVAGLGFFVLALYAKARQPPP